MCIRDRVVTECAQKLIEYIGIVADAQARNADASRRLPMGCPAESGLGEAQQDFYSYTGPLPKSCNRIVADDLSLIHICFCFTIGPLTFRLN